MTEHPFVGLGVAAVLSLLVHGFAYASLGFASPPAHETAPTRVTFRVRDVAPSPPPPTLPKPLEAPPKPEPRTAKAKPKSAPSVNPEPTAPPPAPVDLRGVTLTNDTGSSAWSSAVGNGNALDGPLGPVGRTAAPPPAREMAPRVVARAPEIPVVAIADLSSRPVPPELTTDLVAHYPPDARQRGIGGSATVDARIEPDGRVRQVAVQSETFAGFGNACRKTLLGSLWSAPRDKQGRAVATHVRYTCRFVVDH